MKIKELVLFTNQLEKQKKFYLDLFGFNATVNTDDQFTIQVGHTRLIFRKSETSSVYHYCFMIPSNMLNESIEWLKKKTELISDEDGKVIQFSETWNADSVYFYDGAGNVAEFIAHYDPTSQRESTSKDVTFDLNKILSVNEIGIAVKNIAKLNESLEAKFKTNLWSGNLKRFMANGGPEGRFIVVNKDIKKTWFPTKVKTEVAPFELIMDVDDKCYDMRFANGELSGTLIL